MSVDYHRHCQATVLGATGDPHGDGVTWGTIRDLSLPNISGRVPGWLNKFTTNDNITEDLKAILELIDAMVVAASGGGDSRAWNLVFNTNHGSTICDKTLDPTSTWNTVVFDGFGRDIKIEIGVGNPPAGNQTVRFNTMMANHYYENNRPVAENLSITIPEQKPLAGDLINIGSDGRTVSVNNNISQGYTGLVGIEPVGNGNKRRLVEKEVKIPDPYLTQKMFDQLYPIGSVYITVSSEKPFQGYPGITSDWVWIARGQVLWGCENDGEIGEDKEPGLPNITGTLSDAAKPNTTEPWTFIDGGDLVTTGAVKKYNAVRGKWRGLNTSVACHNNNESGSVPGFQFDASLSNSIYGKSNTVQPPALVVKIWQRVGVLTTDPYN